jgi:hypothetical protein
MELTPEEQVARFHPVGRADIRGNAVRCLVPAIRNTGFSATSSLHSPFAVAGGFWAVVSRGRRGSTSGLDTAC